MNAPVLELSYSNLPDCLYSVIAPQASPEPALLLVNRPLAAELGLDPDWLQSIAALNLFTGQAENSAQQPIAMAYSGHQFGHLSPLLGDGRAALVGEVISPSGVRYDLHLKGSGPTPYSRRGDGLSTLRAALKEYLFTESLAALGIPGSRSLAVVTTGRQVQREQSHPGAILTRVARCHVRVGTFQFAALQQDRTMLQALANFVITREFPHLQDAGDDKYITLLEEISSRQAKLIAQWMAYGFIHGVMNTDNMAVSGETIDFGPCAFMDHFNAGSVYSSIDEQGRYAWNRQADIGVWNLSRLAEALLPLFADNQDEAIKLAEAKLARFPDIFNDQFNTSLAARVGLQSPERKLLADMLQMLQSTATDFTLFFRQLADVPAARGTDRLEALVRDKAVLQNWLRDYEAALPVDVQQRSTVATAMLRVNPLYIPRTHHVEQALAAAREGDMAPFNKLLVAVQQPFEEQTAMAGLDSPPAAGLQPLPTFCET